MGGCLRAKERMETKLRKNRRDEQIKMYRMQTEKEVQKGGGSKGANEKKEKQTVEHTEECRLLGYGAV
jgi:hypothetical protein